MTIEPSLCLLYSKKINGTFYVVEAVPVTKAKTLQVTTAYINKKGAMQLSDVTSPEVTSETPSAYTPSTDNITQPENIVNSNGMQNVVNEFVDEEGNRIVLGNNVPKTRGRFSRLRRA